MTLISRAKAAVVVVVIGLQAQAQNVDEIDALLEALEIPAILEIMQIEGATYGAAIGNDMLPGGGGGSWDALVQQIYDPDKMLVRIRQGFVQELTDADVVPLLAFFTSDAGRKIAALELSARHAFLDTSIEQAARDNYRAVEGTDLALLAQVADYIQANDLIEYNVVGALNSNYQFYRGLESGGAYDMTEDEMLVEAWAAEEETRADTHEWMYAYLLMAYQPLTHDQMQDYLDLSQTSHGRALNRALFTGFDFMYGDITYALGLAVAQHMTAEDL